MSNLSDIARKFRRALRNGTGAHFSRDELRTLADLGVFERLQQAEAIEIQSRWAGQTYATTSVWTDSTGDDTKGPFVGNSSDVTGKPGRSVIEALVAGI